MQGIRIRFGVDPVILVMILIACTPFYYGSIYRLARATAKKDASHVQLWSSVFLGTTALPYIYILAFGRNLPWYIWPVFAVLLGQGGWFLAKKLKARRKKMEPDKDFQSKKLFDFSIIIPAYNEEYLIRQCLESIKNQDYPGKFEIIVVDNGSTDRTAEITRPYAGKYLYESRKGISRALIMGCEHAAGEVLAFSDADTIVPKDWLTRLNHAFTTDPQMIAIGGAYYFFDANILVNSFTKFVTKFYERFLFHPTKPGLPGVNMAIKKDSYLQVGGYKEGVNYGQDTEIALRLAKIGKVAFDSRISVLTSFRRFSAGHVSFILVYLNFFRKLAMQSYRLHRLWHGNKYFAAEEPIRKKSPSLLKKIFINGLSLALVLSSWVIYQATLNPTTQIFGMTIFHGDLKEKQIALTFDDGPYGEATSRILDILKREHVKATFFVTGKNAGKYPQILKREISEGHTVGNHSFDHSMFLAVSSAKKINQNISAAEDAIFKQIGVYPKYFRPPYGIKSPRLIKVIHSSGYRFVLWNDDVDDYNKNEKADFITRRILHKARAGGIVDLHDGRANKENYSRENLIKALPSLIEGLKSKGYQLVTLDRLFKEQPYFPVGKNLLNL